MPSLLFLAEPGEDYVADSLFHGLRCLLGADAVDVPRRAPLYASHGAPESLYGRGFSIYGLLDEIEVDRSSPLERAAAGEFDLVVIGTIWRDWHWWVDAWRAAGPGARYAVVDGADVQWMYPYGPTWWKHPRLWGLPRAHTRAPYFKREWSNLTGWLRWYGLMPPPLSDRIGLHPIAISYPEDKLVDVAPAKSKDFTRHVVDPEVAKRLGGADTGYAFADEAGYTADLRESRFGVTTKRRGWDAMRHYEIAANGCVPCFRELERKPPRCAPHGLQPGVNCLSYAGADELFARVAEVDDDRYASLQAGALEWAGENTTRRRAESFLETVGLA